MIKLIALDIDGVLTDGRVIFDEAGRESKALHYRDIDAVFAAHRRGLQVILVTGENTPLVDVIARRLDVSHVYRNAKDKGTALAQVALDFDLSMDQICYIGDSKRDVPALVLAGLGLAPADADSAACKVASNVLSRRGGEGAFDEALDFLSDLDLTKRGDAS